MSVIGFDIGNESCVIAFAKRGEIHVLLNEESKSETPAVVSFGKKQRFLGSAGAALTFENMKSTVSQIKRLIGKLYKEVEQDLKLLPFATSESPNGGILIELEYLKTKWTFTPVEIMAMLFKHLKQLTEKNLETSAIDCVIGIPSYFTDLQRRMYLDAALVAGLKPLRLMHDGTAIALGYGVYKTDFPNSGPTNVMFVDIGHNDTQVTLASFELGGMNILSHSFDQSLGGRDFDEVLFKHFATQFNEKYKINVYSDMHACLRLRASCEKVKKVLTTNEEATLSIDCLIQDTDVIGFITREEFENLSSKLLVRVIIPCSSALKDSGLSIDEVYDIELIGCGSRIPAIARYLSLFYGKEPTRTLNASECVARGCALHCAMLSPNMIVHEYKIKDSFPYSIVIPRAQGEIMVFSKGTPFPNKNIINYLEHIPFNIQVAYKKERDFPKGISNLVGHFGNLDASTTKDELLAMKEKEKMLAEQDTKVEETEQDTKVEETKDQRNILVTFIYDTRSKLSSSYKGFATNSEKEVIIKTLEEIEDWLYEKNDDEDELDYTGKLKYLKKLLEPIETKYNEEIALTKANKAKKALGDCIAKHHSLVASLPTDKKQMVKNECIQVKTWFNKIIQEHLPPKTLEGLINYVVGVFERRCEYIMKTDLDSKNGRAKGAKPLHTCIAYYNKLADSLTSDKKEKVKNVCREAGQWLIVFIFEKQSSIKNLPTDVEIAVERECKSIIRVNTSFSRHKEALDIENTNAEIAIPLFTCLVNSYSLAKSLPPEKKVKVKNICREAEQWLINFIYQKQSSIKTWPTDINHAVTLVESKCHEIISSESLSSMHEAHLGPFEPSDAEEVKVEFNVKLNENGIVEIDSVTIFEDEHKFELRAFFYGNNSARSHMWNLPFTKNLDALSTDDELSAAKEKEKMLVIKEMKMEETEDQRNALESFVYDTRNKLSSTYWSHATDLEKEAITNKLQETDHYLYTQSDSDPEQDYAERLKDLKKLLEPIEIKYNEEKSMAIAATKALQTCIAKYLSHVDSLPADKKEKVKNACTEAEQWLINVVSQKHSSSVTLSTNIKQFVDTFERNCENITRTKHSQRKSNVAAIKVSIK